MTNNKVYIFTYREMELISEAFYEHFIDDRTEPIDDEILALAKKVEAIPENWTQE